MSEHDLCKKRVAELQRQMCDEKIDAFIISHPDSIYYFSGIYGGGGAEFNRPTMVIIPAKGLCALIVPGVEGEMASRMTWIEDCREWTDGVGGEWVTDARNLLKGRNTIGVENSLNPVVLRRLEKECVGSKFVEVSRILTDQRMVKSPEEITMMREAGEVVVAMADAAVASISEGTPEYEVALAATIGGTRKAAELLMRSIPSTILSPMVPSTQMLMSGPEISMANRQASIRRIQKGDPFLLCFCNVGRYRGFKLSFDRLISVGNVPDRHMKIYEVALKAQEEKLKRIRPGTKAEEVHAAAKKVYQEAGFRTASRSGHGIGYSFVEKPVLMDGDNTVLKPGMTLAVNEFIPVRGEFAAHLGDSIVVTENGFEFLFEYPRYLRIL